MREREEKKCNRNRNERTFEIKGEKYDMEIIKVTGYWRLLQLQVTFTAATVVIYSSCRYSYKFLLLVITVTSYFCLSLQLQVIAVRIFLSRSKVKAWMQLLFYTQRNFLVDIAPTRNSDLKTKLIILLKMQNLFFDKAMHVGLIIFQWQKITISISWLQFYFEVSKSIQPWPAYVTAVFSALSLKK